MQGRYGCFNLAGLPEGWVLILDCEEGILTLSASQRVIKEQQRFGQQEMSIIRMLLENPKHCSCAAAFAALTASNVERIEEEVEKALRQRTLGRYLNRLSPAISRCRHRLALFGIRIDTIAQQGYRLVYVE
ncbi:MAG TPA: hypothetical protein VNG90_01510 [Candidatus Acidoferrum sp.]|nr:hypothetical protein [Candidatus Acidoferrum sp.]